MADFRPPMLILLREVFEGRAEGNNYTWFVEGKEGIFDALETVSAEKASVKPTPECPSIAAHAYHVLYMMRLGNSYIGGDPVEGDWESSWAKQTATDEEWAQLREDIRKNYEPFLSWLQTNEDWSSPEMVTGAMAALPHLAYHLGAIRQLMKVAVC